jgi:hypothetical protein
MYMRKMLRIRQSSVVDATVLSFFFNQYFSRSTQAEIDAAVKEAVSSADWGVVLQSYLEKNKAGLQVHF